MTPGTTKVHGVAIKIKTIVPTLLNKLRSRLSLTF